MTITLGDGITWLEAQPPNSLDGIFTDPPWGTGPRIVGQRNWLHLLTQLLTAAERVVKPEGTILLWYGATQLDPVLRMIAQGTLRFQMIIQVSIGPSWNLNQVIFVLGRRARFPLGKTILFIPTSASANHDSLHPASRPPGIIASLLREWFAPGQRIADPFAGSDTTGWAAGRIGLTCFSFEIDPAMYATALTRRHAQQDLFAETCT